jgi:hypothetical protein
VILRTIVDSADHRFQIGLVGDVQNDAEFIASVPGDEIAGSETALEQLCDCLQGVIAYAVSICVVNVLEVVDIDQDRGESLFPGAQTDLFSQVCVKPLAITQARQIIRVHAVILDVQEYNQKGKNDTVHDE